MAPCLLRVLCLLGSNQINIQFMRAPEQHVHPPAADPRVACARVPACRQLVPLLLIMINHDHCTCTIVPAAAQIQVE